MNKFLGWVALGLALSFSSHARAGGFELFEQAASSAGQASAATARPGDASAAWHNPAALADGEGFRATLGLTLVLSDLRAEGAGFEVENVSDFGTPFMGTRATRKSNGRSDCRQTFLMPATCAGRPMARNVLRLSSRNPIS